MQQGDTLFALLRDGADWESVQRANNIADPKRLQPGSLLRIPAHLLREQPAVAEVVHAYGNVTVTRASTETALPLASGENLAGGDVVRTGAQSSTTLRFADGARVLVRPHSELKIERLAQSRAGASTTLRLERGSADSVVPPAQGASAPSRYEMRTPQVNLGVRGTEFRAAAEGGATRIEVLEGRVSARAGASGARAAPRAESLVAAGFGTVSGASGLAAPRALPAAPQLAGLPERIERMPLRLSWQSAANTRVRAQVLTTDEPPRLVLDGVFDAAPARWSEDIADGRYELRVRAIDADGLEGRDTRAAFVLKARPEPPFIAAPTAGGRTIDDSVRLAWTRNASRRARAPASRRHAGLCLAARRSQRSRCHRNPRRAAAGHAPLARGQHSGQRRPGPVQRCAELHTHRTAGSATAGRAAEERRRVAVALAGPGLDRACRHALAGAVGARHGFAQMVRDETVAEPQLLLRDPPPGTYYLRVKTIDADGFAGPFGQAQQIDVPSSPWWWLIVPAVLLLL